MLREVSDDEQASIGPGHALALQPIIEKILRTLSRSKNEYTNKIRDHHL